MSRFIDDECLDEGALTEPDEWEEDDEDEEDTVSDPGEIVPIVPGRSVILRPPLFLELASIPADGSLE